MRALIAFAALALGGFRASAQAKPVAARPNAGQTPATVGAPAAAADSAQIKNDIKTEIEQHRASGDTYLPDADKFTFGNRTVAAGTRVDGPIAIAHGTLDVYGTVDGDVIALGGDVHVHRSARVTGDAFAAGGSV